LVGSRKKEARRMASYPYRVDCMNQLLKGSQNARTQMQKDNGIDYSDLD